jgi:hypothetical protein
MPEIQQICAQERLFVGIQAFDDTCLIDKHCLLCCVWIGQRIENDSRTGGLMGSSMIKRLGVSVPLLLGGVMCVSIASCRYQELGLREAEGADPAGPSVYFPQITAKNLNNKEITLPDDLAGEPALVLVAFQQRQQINVNTWLDQLELIESSIEGVRVIETPTISGKKWGWMAGFIDGGMRSGIPDVEARARTITLYTDVGTFRQALGLENENTIYSVLLDEQGIVVDIVEGDFEQAKLDQLVGAIN